MKHLNLPVYPKIQGRFLHIRKAVFIRPNKSAVHEFFFYVKKDATVDKPNGIVEKKLDLQTGASYFQMRTDTFTTVMVANLPIHLGELKNSVAPPVAGIGSISYSLKNGAAMRIPNPAAADNLLSVNGAYAAAEMASTLLLISKSGEMLQQHLPCNVYFNKELLLKKDWPETICTLPAKKWLKLFSDISQKASEEFEKLRPLAIEI